MAQRRAENWAERWDDDGQRRLCRSLVAPSPQLVIVPALQVIDAHGRLL
jgi:hypothetical protein